MIALSLKQARHAAVAAQQFKMAEASATQASTFKVVQHLGYVQIDTISVVNRAHHHVLSSRQPSYDPSCLHDLQCKHSKVFEYWAHAMSFVPMEDYRYYIPTMEVFRNPTVRWQVERKQRCQRLSRLILRRIRDEGPLSSKEFENTPSRNSRGKKNAQPEGWWNHKPAKVALEWLFWRGDLMVKERRGFQRVFDLTERILPSHINLSVPTEQERAIWQIERALQVLGVAEEKSILQYLSVARDAVVRRALKEGVDEGRWDLVQINGKEEGTFYGSAKRIAQVLEQKLPQRGTTMLLSPFDNHVINRDRVEQLFDFNYRIECYTPEAKRKYGYFALPILFQEKLIGRADTKAHRKEKRFEVKNLVLEEDIKITQRLVSALAKGIRTFAEQQGCPDVQLTRIQPPSLMAPLSKELF